MGADSGAVPRDGERRSGPPGLAGALALRVQLRRGALVGLALAATVFVLFVALPGATRSPALYLALAFVVAVSAGGLVTVALLAYRAHRLATAE